jgi:hypothetical protein
MDIKRYHIDLSNKGTDKIKIVASFRGIRQLGCHQADELRAEISGYLG